MPVVTVTVSVPPELLESFDRARGPRPRSSLLQDLMRAYVEGEAEDG